MAFGGSGPLRGGSSKESVGSYGFARFIPIALGAIQEARDQQRSGMAPPTPCLMVAEGATSTGEGRPPDAYSPTPDPGDSPGRERGFPNPMQDAEPRR